MIDDPKNDNWRYCKYPGTAYDSYGAALGQLAHLLQHAGRMLECMTEVPHKEEAASQAAFAALDATFMCQELVEEITTHKEEKEKQKSKGDSK